MWNELSSSSTAAINRQLAVMSDLSDDADKTTLRPTVGAIRGVLHTLQQSAAPRAISLDSLLFEGSVEMDNTRNGAGETLGSIFSADGMYVLSVMVYI